ncbi:hypothetical protein GCM10028805_49160 [Spirosoma harenae]
MLPKKWLIIGLLYVIATSINLNKAYHIDDTFHLEAADWIKQHPFKPMSGFINWDENKEPIYKANQPPLYFYFIALISALFGTGEIALHLFQSIFTLFCLLIFYQITQLLSLKNGLLLTAFLAFSPAFLINQNLMVDVPLLFFHLLALYYLLQKDAISESGRYWKVGFFLSISVLIKYTSIPLLVALLVAILWRKQYRYLYIVLIPAAALGLWSLWNYVEFGAVHIVNRPRNPMTFQLFINNVINFITCLGAISPFSLAFILGYFFRNKFVNLLTPLVAVLFVGLTIITANGQLFILLSNDILSNVFFGNGLLIILLVIVAIWNNSFKIRKAISSTSVILLMWIATLSGFIILFAPFVASRHVLLIIPAVLLIGGVWVDKLSMINAWQAVIASASITIILAISDWQIANFYREKAKEAATRLAGQQRIWSAGHWGWQWYARQNGFKEVQADSMQFQTGDYLVKPQGVDSQRIPNGVHLQQVDYLTTPYSWSIFLSTSFYNCFYGRGAAWAYSKWPIDTVKIYKITTLPTTQIESDSVALTRE